QPMTRQIALIAANLAHLVNMLLPLTMKFTCPRRYRGLNPESTSRGGGQVQRLDTHEGSRLRRWRRHPAASLRTTRTGGLHALLHPRARHPILCRRGPARQVPVPLRPRPRRPGPFRQEPARQPRRLPPRRRTPPRRPPRRLRVQALLVLARPHPPPPADPPRPTPPPP